MCQVVQAASALLTYYCPHPIPCRFGPEGSAYNYSRRGRGRLATTKRYRLSYSVPDPRKMVPGQPAAVKAEVLTRILITVHCTRKFGGSLGRPAIKKPPTWNM